MPNFREKNSFLFVQLILSYLNFGCGHRIKRSMPSTSDYIKMIKQLSLYDTCTFIMYDDLGVEFSKIVKNAIKNVSKGRYTLDIFARDIKRYAIKR